MLKKISPFVVLTLLIGLMYGCGGSSNPLVSEAQESVRNQNFEAALTAAEKSIEQYPQDPLGYYYKGVALAGVAETKKDPQDRRDYYERMIAALEKAKELAANTEGEEPAEIRNIDAVKNSVWSQEHNKAIEYASDDSLMNTVEKPLQYAIGHLKNATYVQPDSLLSWDVMGRVYAMAGNFKEAANAMEKVVNRRDSVSVDHYIALSSYYANSDQPQKNVQILEKAKQTYPDTLRVVTKLADAYQKTGQLDKSIALVKELIQTDPQNPQYHLVLGTQIYQEVLDLTDQAKANYNKIDSLNNALRSASGSTATQLKNRLSELQSKNDSMQKRIDELSEQASNELKMVVKYRPDDANAYNTLGIIYQNKAAAVFEKRNRTTDNQKAAELDKQARDLLREAMGYYEKAAELDPDNQSYWQSLFSIYTTLGMDEKAEEAMKKAGLEK